MSTLYTTVTREGERILGLLQDEDRQKVEAYLQLEKDRAVRRDGRWTLGLLVAAALLVGVPLAAGISASVRVGAAEKNARIQRLEARCIKQVVCDCMEAP